MNGLTHLDEHNQPRMVDVSSKNITIRTATARCTVFLPLPIIPSLREGDELTSKKGSVFQTASIAGIMAAKRTDSLIPLCHGLPLEHCSVDCRILSDTEVEIMCTAKTSHKTGVEMEALTGASLAALTIYDMCKALSHDIEIRSVALVAKTGGKSDYARQ